jgi:hypothetical protein
MAKALDRRLRALESAWGGAQGKEQVRGAEVVIYALATGQPLAPVPAGAAVLVWLPDNGREERATG